MSKQEYVILVDDQDRVVAAKEKMQAHIDGDLHRAFSVFLFDEAGRCLLQKRADGKYHSAGLWSNACCSHPRPDEAVTDAVQRRLHDELGMSCSVMKAFEIAYDLEVGQDLREAEYNHTFVGVVDSGVSVPFNRDEMSDIAWRHVPDIKRDLKAHPQHYTSWFHLLFPKVLATRQDASMTS